MNYSPIHSFKSRPPVVWITGMSGSGKSTTAQALLKKLRPLWQSTMIVDGDAVREICNHDLSFSTADRLTNAYRIAKLCKFLHEQDTLVICSTISFFHEIHEWNRTNLNPYIEVLIKADLDELKRRNSKGLYHENDNAKNVVGIDQILEEPKTPDLVLQNNSDGELLLNIDTIAKSIYSYVQS